MAGSFGLIPLLLHIHAVGAAAPAVERGDVQMLKQGWAIQSAAKITAAGAAISQPGFATAGWYGAEVPSTVLGALVKAGVYKDPFFAKNMDTIRPEPFKTSWWY